VRHITESPDGNSPRYLIGLEFIALPAAATEHIDELMAANASPVGETRLLGTEE
jgi:hypothetical protein